MSKLEKIGEFADRFEEKVLFGKWMERLMLTIIFLGIAVLLSLIPLAVFASMRSTSEDSSRTIYWDSQGCAYVRENYLVGKVVASKKVYIPQFNQEPCNE